MGGLSSENERDVEKFFPNFHRADWVEVPAEQMDGKTRFGDYTTLRNCLTHEQIDRFQLTFESEQEQRVYEQDFMRRLRDEHLVNSYHYEAVHKTGTCSGLRVATAYIQHIPIRLSDITDIPLDESLYIMECCMLGFGKLHSRVGYFQVMEEHIGIDQQGHGRVWLNADVSRNSPYAFDHSHFPHRDGRVMTMEIITLIEKNTAFPKQLTSRNTEPKFVVFSTFVERSQNKSPSFSEACDMMREYAHKYAVQIAKKCNHVVQVFREDYGQDFNLTNDSIESEANYQFAANNRSRQSHKSKSRLTRSIASIPRQQMLNSKPLLHAEAELARHFHQNRPPYPETGPVLNGYGQISKRMSVGSGASSSISYPYQNRQATAQGHPLRERVHSHNRDAASNTAYPNRISDSQLNISRSHVDSLMGRNSRFDARPQSNVQSRVSNVNMRRNAARITFSYNSATNPINIKTPTQIRTHLRAQSFPCQTYPRIQQENQEEIALQFEKDVDFELSRHEVQLQESRRRELPFSDSLDLELDPEIRKDLQNVYPELQIY